MSTTDKGTWQVECLACGKSMSATKKIRALKLLYGAKPRPEARGDPSPKNRDQDRPHNQRPQEPTNQEKQKSTATSPNTRRGRSACTTATRTIKTKTRETRDARPILDQHNQEHEGEEVDPM